MSKQRIALVVVALLAASNHRLPADEPPPGQPPSPQELFSRLDSNGDGVVSEDEVPDEKRRLFERLLRVADKDGDKRLTAAELAEGIKSDRPRRPLEEKPAGPDGGPSGEMLFTRLDANSDGKIVAEEVPPPRRERFEMILSKADKNGDGALDKEEWTRAFPVLAQAFAGRPGGRPLGGPRPGDRLLRVLDTDKNGELSAEEIASAPSALRTLDKNDDGRLTREEWFEGPAERPGPRGGDPEALKQRIEELKARLEKAQRREEKPKRE